MSRRSRLRYQAGAAALVVAFVSLFSVEGTLLCLGPDGHIAIEFVGSCKGTGFGSQLAGREDDSCGPCQDVQLITGPADRRNISSTSITAPVALLFAASALSLLNELPGRPSPATRYVPLKSLTSQRSVVLLI